MTLSMERTWSVFELLATRARIETALSAGGFDVDVASRETITDALHVYVDDRSLDIEDAEALIISAFLEPLRYGGEFALN